MRKAVVSLSGGLDSTVCMALAAKEGYEIHPISFYYGQRHRIEIESARAVAEHYGVAANHKWVDIQRAFAGSSLTDLGMAVPTGRGQEEMGAGIPSTYVPARNIVFLSHALAHAESIGAEAIYIGVNALDYSGYPDCRPEFIAAFQQVIDLGTAAGVEGRGIRLAAPLQNLTKAQISRLGVDLEVPLELTHSCYEGLKPACGVCDSCLLRIKGFQEAGLVDPIPYAQPIPWLSK